MCNQCIDKQTLKDKISTKLFSITNQSYFIKKSFSEGTNPFVNHKKFQKEAQKGYKILNKFFFDKSKLFKQNINDLSSGVGFLGKVLDRTGIKKATPVRELTYEEIVGVTNEIFDKEEFYNIVHSFYGDELPQWFAEELKSGMIDQGITEVASTPLINDQAQKNLTDYFYKWSTGYMVKVQSKLEDVVLFGFDQGKSTKNIAKDIVSKIKNIGTKNAEMIARTESIRVSAEISIGTYKDVGVSNYDILPAINACPICKGKAANNPYKIDDRSGMPSIHVNCRCSVIPMFIDNKLNNLLSKTDKETFDKFYNREVNISDRLLTSQIEEANKLGLSEIERKSITLYTGHPISFEVNSFLRGNSENNKLNVFSNVLSGTLNKLPNYTGSSIRGIKYRGSREDTLDFVKSLVNKGEYNSKGYLSTTTDFNHSIKFGGDDWHGIFYNIKSKTGSKLKNIETMVENEILFDKGSNFEVTGYRKLKSDEVIGMFGDTNMSNRMKTLIEEGEIDKYIIDMVEK